MGSTMVNPKFIEGMAEQLGQMLSQAPNLPGQDAVQEQIRAVLQNSFAKLDLVTRDEFDAQTAVFFVHVKSWSSWNR